MVDSLCCSMSIIYKRTHTYVSETVVVHGPFEFGRFLAKQKTNRDRQLADNWLFLLFRLPSFASLIGSMPPGLPLTEGARCEWSELRSDGETNTQVNKNIAPTTNNGLHYKL